ncbi:MAG: hypothetical protein AAF650_11275 [Pseudomonadota bacterium]
MRVFVTTVCLFSLAACGSSAKPTEETQRAPQSHEDANEPKPVGPGLQTVPEIADDKATPPEDEEVALSPARYRGV